MIPLIVDTLDSLSTWYSLEQDMWRAKAMARAARVVQTTAFRPENPSASSGIGSGIEDIILQIQREGKVAAERILHSIADVPRLEAFRRFKKILSIGDKKSQELVAAGLRDIAELQSQTVRQRFGIDTEAVKVGIQFYDQINARVDRKDATKIIRDITSIIRTAGYNVRLASNTKVSDNISKNSDDFSLIAMGSYRRGSSTVGDIDILLLPPMMPTTRNKTFPEFPRDVVNSIQTKLGNDFLLCLSAGHKRLSFLMKYQSNKVSNGVCQVDMFLMPGPLEAAAFLLHGTGSAHFNESLRGLAKKMGFRLNEYGLFDVKGLTKKGTEIGNKNGNVREGRRIMADSEAKIFEALGGRYVPPEKRSLDRILSVREIQDYIS